LRQDRLRGNRSIAAVAALIVLLAGACSNSSKTSTNSPSPSTAAGGTAGASGPFANLAHIDAPNPCVLDPGVTATDIKIGVIAPLTGPQAASFSDAVTGLKARVDKANSTSEAGARKITLVVRDDAADQTKNLQQVRDLVENAKVWAIVEVTSASGGGAAYLQQHGVPVTGSRLQRP
jgi:branched-chain amino acid transport system substrate-binding protein